MQAKAGPICGLCRWTLHLYEPRLDIMTQTTFRPDRTVAVYGALRSGTTLLRLMLDAHPQLSCPGETDFIFDHLRGSGPAARYDETAMERDRIYRAHRTLYAGTPLPDLTPDALINRIAGADSIAVLMLHRRISRAVAIYPDLRIIHFLRDPRDVARSSIGMGWAGNVYYGIDHWLETETDWARIAPDLPENQVLTIHYEDLIAAPENTLRLICGFLGVDYTPAMLAYDKTSTYDKPSKDLSVQWKHKQTPRDVGLIEAKIGPLLTACGYQPSGFAPRQPSLFEKLGLALGNKRARWTKRVQRYGFVDPLIVTLAHKLRAPHLSAAAQRRIDTADIKRLK